MDIDKFTRLSVYDSDERLLNFYRKLTTPKMYAMEHWRPGMQIVNNEPNLSLFQITVVVAEYDFHGQELEYWDCMILF